jgi:aspartyl-tRNA(Asn)/glutamyl-tRNA(Gln) amidotransferase subunit C
MANLTKETVHYLTKLARIACTKEQEDALFEDMQKIVSYVELLDELNTEGVAPCNTVVQYVEKTPLRPDAVGQTLSREEFLKNSPSHIGGMIRVPPVLQNRQ